MPNFYVIHNSYAGKGPNNTNIVNDIRKLHHIINWFDTEYVGHATYLAKNLAKTLVDSDAVVLVIGGDGTLNDVLNGLLAVERQTALPIAYIPTGTGNNFARGASLGSASDALFRLKQTNQVKNLSIGKIIVESPHQTTRYFVNSVGVGFDANVVIMTEQSNLKKMLNKFNLGSYAYLLTAITAFFNQNAFHLTLTNGEKYKHIPEIMLATIVNQPFFGGGIPILPSADLSKFELELLVIEKVSFFGFLKLLFDLKRNSSHLNHKKVHRYMLAKGAQIHIHDIQPGQIDGETLGNGSFVLTTTCQSYPFWIN